MSLRNGRRARFHLQRTANIHKRTRIRELRKALKEPKPSPGEAAGSAEAGRMQGTGPR